jgi:hypothetical protein
MLPDKPRISSVMESANAKRRKRGNAASGQGAGGRIMKLTTPAAIMESHRQLEHVDA